MSRAEIVVHRAEVFPGRYLLFYEWEGPPSAPVWIDTYRIDIDRLPWPLVMIDDRPDLMAQCFVRTDVGLGLPALCRRAWAFLRRQTDLAYRRLILTAMVWGWAWVPFGDIPNWRHLGRRRP